MLLICPPNPKLIPELPLIVSSHAEPLKRKVEPAGKAYHDYCCRKLGLEITSTDSESSEEEAESELDARLREKYRNRLNASELLEKDDDQVNLYEVLGLGEIGFSASQKQIKKAYQRMILLHHPDKNQGKETETFLLIQKAFDILGNLPKRRGYDSSFDFDDSIPSGHEMTDFYELFTPVFVRNARFSAKKPVPGLGDEKTSMKEVEKFYNFWQKFESWREFSKFDEFKDGDLENAGSRFERRWMQKQNDNIRSKKKKKEYERLRLLIERCRKCDPRIKKELEKQNLLKEKRKQEKLKQIQLKKEKEEEEKLRKETEKKEKEMKEKQRKKQQALEKKKEENELKELKIKFMAKTDSLPFNQQNQFINALNFLCRHDIEAAKELKGHLETLEPIELFKKVKQKTKLLRLEKEKAKNEAKVKSKKQEMIPWTSEELSLLAKGVKKYPGGSRNRWQLVAEYVNNNKEGKERTMEECLAMVKSIGENKANANTTKASNSKTTATWSTEEQQLLEQGLKQFSAKLEKKERWSKIAQLVKTKTRKECFERYKYIRQKLMESKK